MAITRYEVYPPDGYPRILQIDGTININQILHLQKPTEDRRGPDDFRPYKVIRHRTEVRETSPGVLEDVRCLDLERVEEES